MTKLTGLATGVGSMPQKTAKEAVDLIFKYTAEMPFWPQLPKRDVREGMVAQYSENLPFLKMGADGLKFSGLEAREGDLEIFYERVIANDADYFKISPEYASGLHGFYQRLEKADLKTVEFIKCQVVGPFTFAAGIQDEKGVSLLHDAVFLQAVIKGLAMKAAWQIKLFRKFRKKIILFFDEPYLGCFGSAYTPINREDVVRSLAELTGDLKSADVKIGVHCCGNTDWSMLADVGSIDIINFDAFDFLDRFVLYADNLKKFFKRGGIICWGVVPTQQEELPGAQVLKEKILSAIDLLAKKGVDKELAANNLILSPACGLGTLAPQKAEQILQLLNQTSQLIRK